MFIGIFLYWNRQYERKIDFSPGKNWHWPYTAISGVFAVEWELTVEIWEKRSK
ncbi:hypothetical protein DMR_15090 [Solidesulfovibrio magneticus RS-1]|uniref:Uncharacterized protein n=1 Tax=Solidesulfovibrio magneticus (strain ATCC 700980 / DSM 13731 / RS-1) TaxID=573370 RepID=C4XNM5_SOLM1|nr:hypothetical protein DMR_15090 [Solidesulfovibrio magneticus RS-1]